jgi:hypothetical protein
MKFNKATMSLAIGIALASPIASYAQDTTSSIRGRVMGADGGPVTAANIAVTDTRTGVVRRYATNSSGSFFAPKLAVGGPYTVTVNGANKVTINSISLGDTYNMSVDLSSIEEVVVIGTLQALDVAPGPSASYGLFELESSVAINRDISDVYAIDPRLNLDADEDGFAVNCGGKHPRFNSTTLDGVSQGDRFGLNENSYSTATGQPFPYDAVQQVSVSLAPFDVTFGGFSACNINAVTKSGSNEWEGGVFYDWSSDSLKGTSLGEDAGDLSNESYNESKRGFHLGGPLIEDKLFFYVAYEESEKPRFLAKGFAGSGNGVERDFLSEGDYNRIVDIANNIYNYDPGGQPGNGTAEDEKYSVRIDWNINEDHNAAVIYNYYDGFQARDSDGDSNEFEFANHYYEKGAESETYTVKLASQWSDAFSTEVFYSDNEMNDAQNTVGPNDFADMQISIGGRAGTVYLGADDSRQANSLNTASEYFKLSGQYLWGNHLITAGYETEELTIFNEFVQHSNGGEYDFFDDSSNNAAFCANLGAQGRQDDPDCRTSGIDKFELGLPSRIYYGSGGGTNVAADAGATFTNTQHSFFIQDEMYFDEYDLTVTAGLRYERFDTNDAPTYNDAFTQANGGVRNDENIDGLSIVMPRIGFTWEAQDDLTVRGGIGLYSGGNPNVWLSNAFSNDGFTNVQLRKSFGSDSILGDLPLSREGRPGYDVPQVFVDEVLATTIDNASTSRLVLLDPDYDQPSEWKFAIGATYDLPWGGIQADIDYLHTKGNDPAIYVDLSQSITGQTADGKPIYSYTNGRDNYMLTNSGRSPSSDTFSLVLKKDFDNGVDLQFGYAYTDAEDVNHMGSSTAGSNWDNVSTSNPNDVSLATSNYVTPHRFTFRASYGAELFSDLTTRVTLMAYATEGQPQSFVMGSGDLEGDGFFGRHLLYVPTGSNDPLVEFESSFDQDEFFAWADRKGLGAGYQKRNENHASWTSRVDLRFDQELPTFIDGTEGKISLKIYNLGNMLNEEWGHVNDAEFFSVQAVRSGVNDQGQYVFENFDGGSINDLKENSSLWNARLSLEFTF